MKRHASLYLEDICRSIIKIEKYTRGMSFARFKRNALVIDAVVRNLEIIGEAAKNIPAGVRARHLGVPWQEAIGMRNKITHEYFGVDVEIIWETVKKDIPVLKRKIMKVSV